MAIIIETCPKCGHDLRDVMLASYPPIPKKECWNCGWSWTGEREDVIRVPFGDNDSLQCAVNEITEMKEKEIQEYLKATIKTMVTNYTNKYME
jgi:hypothetical protein